MFPGDCLRRGLFALALLLAACATGGARVLAPAPGQPAGALTGRIVFTSGGHGWTYDNSADAWYTQRGDTHDVVEDYGNLDQMNLFTAYCFNAGATVVAFRPIGNQTNEVVLDNTSPAVRFTGPWSDSSATVNYFGQPGAVPYRFAAIAATETATATYAPTIPAAGFYPVYCWASHGTNRTTQLYLINHSGGQARVRVPHQKVGNGWIYLGTYHFEVGSNSLSGAVIISNLEPAPRVGSVVIADAIRFGNGLGDVVPVSTGGGTPAVSGYPREEECARYWIQRMVGVGASSSLYDTPGSEDGSDNVGAPPRMAREMNNEDVGSLFDRVFLSFHSNASGSTNPTARGCVGLYNNETLFPGTSTPNQFRLAQLVATELNGDMAAIPSPPLEVAWFSRSGANLTFARSDFAFGEINNSAISDEFDATIIEVAFHDNEDDAKLLRDPRVRNVMARASYQGLVRYMNEFAGAPLVFLPEPPGNVRAVANAAGHVVVSWSPPGSGGGSASGYLVYRSTNGYGFGQAVGVAGGTAGSVTFSNLAADVPWYFRVAATNAGGESMPSETAACRRSSQGGPRALVVNGFDRFDRALAPRQTAGPGIGGPAGGTQTFDRVLPRRMNAFDYVVQHGEAIHRCGVPFDSCQNDALLSGQVALTNYAAVLWALGEESTADETFSSAEQTVVSNYLARGGCLFVSGSEIAWDLDRASGPTAADRAFLRNQLHATLGGDTNDDAGTSTFASVVGGIFAGNASGRFDDGSAGIYAVRYPDVLTPAGSNALAALSYTGGLPGAAAIQHADPLTGSRLVYLGFPFETVTNPVVREALMFDSLAFFGVVPPPVLAVPTMPAPGSVRLTWSALPGRRYRTQFKDRLDAAPWTNQGAILTATGPVASVTNLVSVTSPHRFYRVVMVD
jgi:hypothetical protein